MLSPKCFLCSLKCASTPILVQNWPHWQCYNLSLFWKPGKSPTRPGLWMDLHWTETCYGREDSRRLPGEWGSNAELCYFNSRVLCSTRPGRSTTDLPLVCNHPTDWLTTAALRSTVWQVWCSLVVSVARERKAFCELQVRLQKYKFNFVVLVKSFWGN